jgi:hypothetical protein
MPDEANMQKALAGAFHGEVPTLVRAQSHNLAQSGMGPDSLHTPARLAQSLEPILFPKLQI